MDMQKARLNEILTDTLKEWDVDCQPETIAQMAEHLLSSGVTVPVRCEDCRYCESGKLVGGGEYFECRCREFLDDDAESIAVSPDDFCSYGKPKERES